FSLRPTKRFHFLTPFSALKQSRKQQAPQSLKWFLSPKGDDGDDDDKEKRKGKKSEGEGGMEGDSAVKGTLLAGVLLVGFVGGFAGVGNNRRRNKGVRRGSEKGRSGGGRVFGRRKSGGGRGEMVVEFQLVEEEKG
ncbi:hypothetical protein Tsubulata_017488, partial [Turnera subulata]